MKTFDMSELESLIGDLNPHDNLYYYSLSPALDVIYQDTLDSIRMDAVWFNERGLIVFDSSGDILAHKVTGSDKYDNCVFVEKKGYEKDNDYVYGIVITNSDPEVEKRIYEHVLDAACNYDSASIWVEVKVRGIRKETPQEMITRIKKHEMGCNYRYIKFYEGIKGVRGVWTYDNELFLWGSHKEGSVVPNTPFPTMCIRVGNSDAGYPYGRLIADATSPKPIITADLYDCGFLKLSGGEFDTNLNSHVLYFADDARTDSFNDAFDKLVISMDMNLTYDIRNA